MNKEKKTVLHQVVPADKKLIADIGELYFNEWGFARETVIDRLCRQPNNDILLQLAIVRETSLLAAGGLYNNVGLLTIHPQYHIYKPWVAMLATIPAERNKGHATRLLLELEQRAAKMKFNKIYLYTWTAEKLYERHGWKTFERVSYKSHLNAIMVKSLD